MLVSGRERPYLQAFFNARLYDPSAIGDREIDLYASVYAAPGAMRARFELYRAFDLDRAAIATLAADGIRPAAIALQVGCSRMQVYRIIKEI